MDEKIKELIAIGASITAHCQPCLKYHIEQAVKLGISTEEISAAISVGKLVEKGALKSMETYLKEQIEMITKGMSAEKEDSCCFDTSNCCL